MRLLAGLFVTVLTAVPALAGDSSALPDCGSPAVVGSIIERQTWAERHTWHDGVVIAAIGSVREWQSAAPHSGTFDIRHCTAEAEMAGATPRHLVYTVTAGQGFAGNGWKVDFCLPSHDRYRVYGAACRTLR